MSKRPRALSGEQDRLRAAQADRDLSKQEIPSGWRDALLTGNLATYAAIRITDLLDGIGLNIALALDRPDRAAVASAVALYDGIGALWDVLAPAFGEAITDIYKKVFEEGWFSREVSAKEIDISRDPPSIETRMGFKEIMALQQAMLPHTPEKAAQARHEPEIDGPSM